MTVFKTPTHQDIWIEANCHTCFQPDEAARRLHGKDTECPIIKRYNRTGKKPKAWDRTRSTELSKTITCRSYLARPEAVRRGVVNEFDQQQDSLFDIPTHEAHFVRVEGWPERPTTRGTEHA